MNCRTFQKNLEDYLEGGLDFSGRFGMERHAEQCIACGKEMANAQRLKHMVRDLERVKAPSTFESSVLNELAKRKLHGRFFRIRRNWVYGLERLSWHRWVPIAAAVVVFGLGLLYWFKDTAPDRTPASPWAANVPAKTGIPKPAGANPEPDPSGAKLPIATEAENAETETQAPDILQDDLISDAGNSTAEYIEFSIVGSENLPATIQLPNKIRMQYEQPSEEYFIQNVSH